MKITPVHPQEPKPEYNMPFVPAFVVEGAKLLERTREKRADSRIVSPGEMQARQSQRALIQVIALRQAFEPLHHVLGERGRIRRETVLEEFGQRERAWRRGL